MTSSNQQSATNTTLPAESAAIQRSSSTYKKAGNRTNEGESTVWRGIVNGLLGVLLLADAVIIGLLANHYLFTR